MTSSFNQQGQGSSSQTSSTSSSTSGMNQVIRAATFNGMKKINKRKRGGRSGPTAQPMSGVTSSTSGSMSGMTSSTTSSTPIQQMMPPPLPPPPAPVLRATAITGNDREGQCGYFVRERNWSVDNPVAGFIIQQVTRTFNVEEFQQGGWQPINGAALDTYVTDPGSAVYATHVQYWEIWEVTAGGQVPDNPDTFGLCSLIPRATKKKNTTRGRFVMTGVASFYPTATVTAAQLGFTQGAAAPAGLLLSRTTDPATALGQHGLVASGAPVQYTVTVTWDSSQPDIYSNVV